MHPAVIQVAGVQAPLDLVNEAQVALTTLLIQGNKRDLILFLQAVRAQPADQPHSHPHQDKSQKQDSNNPHPVRVVENLATLSSLLRNGVISKTSNGYRITNDLARYLEGTDDPDGQAASLIGDGLASCVLGFDHTDQERSRTIILASDNEVNGEGLYTLKEAIDFAKRQKVEVIGLYPGSTLTTEGEDMKNQVESTGGEFYTMSSSGTVDSIVQNIEAQQKREVEGDARVTVTDRVNKPVAWLAVAIVAFLGLVGFAKL